MTAEALAQNSSATEPPSQIRLRRKQNVVEITWPDGLESQLSCLSLRKSCACSGCSNARQKGAISLIDADIGIDNLNVRRQCHAVPLQRWPQPRALSLVVPAPAV